MVNFIQVLFSGAFANFEKKNISFVLSVCLSDRMSVRTEQLGSHWMDFYYILYLSIFLKSFKKIQVSVKSDRY